MANLKRVKREKITVELMDEVERTLLYTMESFALIEERFGSVDKGLNALSSEDGVNFKMTDIVFFLYVGLVHSDEELTEKKVARLMDVRDLAYYMERLALAIREDVPTQEVSEKK